LCLWLKSIVAFASGYFISAVSRAVSAVLARALIERLNPAVPEIAFLMSTYSLTFAMAKLPL
jgi:hypothetical protein